jgi:CheY-like chemotaxis protein
MEPGVELLLVEDNDSDVELTLHVLKKHNLANRIKVLRDGAEALEFIFSADSETLQYPKLILLDLKLPKVNGLEVLSKLKADPRTVRIPVIVLTSSRQDSDLFACYRLGVNSYIVKPVDFGQFTEAVRQLGYYWLLLNQQSEIQVEQAEA